MGARFKDLKVWQDSLILVKSIYTLTKSSPAFERYGLASQLQRAIVSAPSNIAEGSGLGTKKEFVHFLTQARGSVYEAITQLEIAGTLSYIDKETLEVLEAECKRLA